MESHDKSRPAAPRFDILTAHITQTGSISFNERRFRQPFKGSGMTAVEPDQGAIREATKPR
jgi:hypothetical protein